MQKNNIGHDLLKKIEAIDKREKPKIKAGNVLKSITKTIKGDKTSLKSSLGLDFEEKKLADKQRLILEYPFPETAEDMLLFADFLRKMIANKEQNSTELLSAWRKKLNQLKLLIDSKHKNTDECAKINTYYQYDIRKQKRKNIIGNPLFLYFMFLLLLSSIGCLIYFLISWSIVGVFFSVLGFIECIMLTIYTFGSFDKALVNNKVYNKSKLTKFLCMVGWIILPFTFSGWLTAIIFRTFVSLILLSILLVAYVLYLSYFSIREVIWIFLTIVITCFILSIIYSYPTGLFFSLTALLYCPILILHIYNLLNKLISTTKKYINRKPHHNLITHIMFLIIIPSIAGLIVSIIFNSLIFIIICFLIILMEILYSVYLYEL